MVARYCVYFVLRLCSESCVYIQFVQPTDSVCFVPVLRREVYVEESETIAHHSCTASGAQCKGQVKVVVLAEFFS